jgi:hypothetical protein
MLHLCVCYILASLRITPSGSYKTHPSFFRWFYHNALINSVYEPAHFFVSQYDFSVANDEEDETSPGVQP